MRSAALPSVRSTTTRSSRVSTDATAPNSERAEANASRSSARSAIAFSAVGCVMLFGDSTWRDGEALANLFNRPTGGSELLSAATWGVLALYLGYAPLALVGLRTKNGGTSGVLTWS